MYLRKIDNGAVTLRLFTDDCRLLALACHLAGYGFLDRLAPDRPTQEARALLYQALTCLFESLASAAVAHESIPDHARRDATPAAIRKGWVDQECAPTQHH